MDVPVLWCSISRPGSLRIAIALQDEDLVIVCGEHSSSQETGKPATDDERASASSLGYRIPRRHVSGDDGLPGPVERMCVLHFAGIVATERPRRRGFYCDLDR